MTNDHLRTIVGQHDGHTFTLQNGRIVVQRSGASSCCADHRAYENDSVAQRGIVSGGVIEALLTARKIAHQDRHAR